MHVAYDLEHSGALLNRSVTVISSCCTLQERDSAAAIALAELGPVLQQQQLLTPLKLELQGLSHFRHQVRQVQVSR